MTLLSPPLTLLKSLLVKQYYWHIRNLTHQSVLPLMPPIWQWEPSSNNCSMVAGILLKISVTYRKKLQHFRQRITWDVPSNRTLSPFSWRSWVPYFNRPQTINLSSLLPLRLSLTTTNTTYRFYPTIHWLTYAMSMVLLMLLQMHCHASTWITLPLMCHPPWISTNLLKLNNLILNLKNWSDPTQHSLTLQSTPLPFSNATICDVSTGTPRPFVPSPLRRIVFAALHSLSILVWELLNASLYPVLYGQTSMLMSVDGNANASSANDPKYNDTQWHHFPPLPHLNVVFKTSI